jgi:hypothetical protein
MDPRVLVQTALRVLIAWTHGRKPAPEDVQALRTAFPSCSALEDDELACQVIHDLSEVAFPHAELPNPLPRAVDDVA